MTTETVPFNRISSLATGQPVTFKSRFGDLIGVVGDVCEGAYVGIRNVTGEWRITPMHVTEGHLVAEFT